MKLAEWDGMENLYTEAVPAFAARYDVIVAGLGTAGAVAATVAAKAGLSVLGIEANGLPGGTATLGHIYSYYYGVKGGFYCEMDALARDSRTEGYSNMGNENCLSAYAKLHAIYAYHARYGVVSAYNATVTGVFLEGNRVCGLRYVDANGPHDVAAAYVIDCTGNAAVCLLAGCEMQGGRAFDGRFQPYSNVLLRGSGANQSVLNIDSGYLNPYDPLAYGNAVLTSAMAPHYLPETQPQEWRMLACSALLGIREGLRIVGEETVSLRDWLNEKQTKAPVFFGRSNIDNHGKDTAFEDRTARDWATVCAMWGYVLTFPVPAGALIPKGFEGLLAAGRLLSADHNMASALRMKDEMCKSGEAAAQLAVLALQNACDVRKVPYAQLRGALLATGCLKAEDAPRVEDTFGQYESPAQGPLWLQNAEEIRRQLESDRPGYAIWSAVRMGDTLRPALEDWLVSGTPKCRNNSALALGLLGSHRADAVLLELAGDTSGYIPKTSRKYNPLQAVSAVSLCGRLGLRAACPLLFSMIEDEHYADVIPFVPDEFMQIRQEVYFQLFTHAMMSLFEIGTQHADLRPEILQRLHKRLWSPDCRLIVCLKAGNAQTYDLLPQVREMFSRLAAMWDAE